MPAGRDEQALTPQLAPVVDLEDILLALASRCRRVRGQHELDAFASQHLAECLTQRRRLTGQHVLGHVDDRRLAAEPAHGLRDLDAHRPATEDQQAARERLHRRRIAAGPNAVELAQTRDRRDHRIGAVGKNHVVSGVAHAVDLDDARTREPPGAAQQVDAAIGQPALLPGVRVVGHHEVAPGKRRLDIDLGTRCRLTRRMDRLTRSQQRLRRDTGPVRALAANELALHDPHTQAGLRERAGTMLARRAAAEHDHVIVAAHCGSSSPARSRTIYRAYQIATLSSRSERKSRSRAAMRRVRRHPAPALTDKVGR